MQSTNTHAARNSLFGIVLAIGTILFLSAAIILLQNSKVRAAGPVVTCTTNEALFNTAFDGGSGTLAAGSRDTNWEVGVGDASGPSSVPSWEQAYVVGHIVGLWATSPFGNADWIAHNSTATNGGPSIDAYFRYDFELGNEVLLDNFSLKMDFYADNSVPEIWVNGVPQSGKVTGLPQAPGNPYFHNGFGTGDGASLTLPFDWKHGQNEMIVRVASGPPETGFMAQFRDEALCANPQYTATKTANPASGSTVYPGDTVSYTVTVKNTGSVDFNNLTFSDNLSDILDNATLTQQPVVSPASAGTATITNNTLAFQGNVAVGQSATITYAVKVKQNAQAGATLRNEVIGASSNCATGQASMCKTAHTVGAVLAPTGQSFYTYVFLAGSSIIIAVALIGFNLKKRHLNGGL